MNETNGADRNRVCIISSSSIQTQSLAQVLGEKTGIDTVVRSDLRRTASTVSVGNHHTLILIDSLYIAAPSALDQLENLPAPLASNVMVALLNMPKDEAVEVRALAVGVKGFFPVNADLDFVVRGISLMFEGEIWVPRKLLATALFNPDRVATLRSPRVAELLTRREREILSLISIGSSNDEIAARLNISSNTVRTHLYNLYRKINVPNRMQAALWGAENL
jgi:DNA-binding NarL/FixJ family response regulator